MSGSCGLSEVGIDRTLGKGGGADGEKEEWIGPSSRMVHRAGLRGRTLRGTVLSLTGSTILT